LFLNAGSILYRTNTQDLNKLGGLISIMPLTAITSFIASMSISGVPPLNGFASKWSIYVGAIQGGKYAPYLIPLGFIAIFTSVLTLALFIKYFCTSFLSRNPPCFRKYGKIRT
jgi:formate hydrogenlyase subunit 3/multisubunit Na+/H+ antiporter MnhD subunit